MATNAYDGIVFVVCQESDDVNHINKTTILNAHHSIEAALNDIQSEAYKRVDELISEGTKIRGVGYTDFCCGVILGLKIWAVINGQNTHITYRVELM